MSTNTKQDGVGVPRRFGMRAMAAFMVLFAGVFALLKVLKAPVVVVAFLVAYLAALGIGQACLCGGRDPRRASVYVGLVFYPTVGTALVAIFSENSEALLCMMFTAVPMGAISGYVLGAILASIFLFIREGVDPEAKPGEKPDQVE